MTAGAVVARHRADRVTAPATDAEGTASATQAAATSATDAAANEAAGSPRRAAEAAAAAKPKGLLHYLSLSLSAALLVLVGALAVATILLPALVGGRPLTVLTQSMEPGLPPGTLIVVRPETVADIRIGDVLTYQIESGKPAVVSHRVIEKTFSTDGSTTFVTKGDNNDLADEKPVQEVQIVGTLWYSVPLLGWVNNAVNGEARAVIVPVAVTLLFGYAAWMLVSSLRDARRKKRGGPDAVAGDAGSAPRGRRAGLTQGDAEGDAVRARRARSAGPAA